jgi:hypothetical protein
MWSADPFTSTRSAEEHPAEPAAKRDFAFAGLLHEAARSPKDKTIEEPRPPEATRGDTVQDMAPVPQYPGDEPTRVEPVSPALLDKLRERDEGEPPASPPMDQTIQGWGSVVSGGEQPAEPEVDPDEEHWRETFEKFRELKARLGEPADRISFEKFSAKLRKNRDDLLAKHSAKGVRFVVYEKAGRAAIKASAIR